MSSIMMLVRVGVIVLAVFVSTCSRAHIHTSILTPSTYLRKLESWDQYGGMCVRAHYLHKQTDQTTTLCVQEVEIYLERWEVLGALVDVCVERRKGS